jgi:hypothetical protein
MGERCFRNFLMSFKNSRKFENFLYDGEHTPSLTVAAGLICTMESVRAPGRNGTQAIKQIADMKNGTAVPFSV